MTYTAPVGTDSCLGSSTAQIAGLASGAAFSVGVTTNTFQVTDAALNTAECSFSVTVSDTQNPTITCSSTNVQCAGEVPPVGTNTVAGSDNCGPVTLTWLGDTTNSLGCVNHFAILRTYKATDASGNTNSCTQTITVNDTPPPVALCANITVNLDANGLAFITAADVNRGSYDNCFGTVNLSVNRTIFGCGNIGANTVSLTVVDQCGNSNSCAATVTIRDVTAPTISCPANVTANANAGQCCASGVALGTATVSDNRGASVVNNATSCIPAGTNFVVWTATDASGNSATCTQQVVVVDNQPMVISCPADVTVNIPAETTCACPVPLDDVALGTATASGNCVASLTNNAPSCFPVRTNLVVWTATDIYANSVSCTQRVIVALVTVDEINLRILAIEAIDDLDIPLTWQTFGNSTNVIQLVSPNINGNFTNSFIDLDTVVVPAVGEVITDWVDYGGATNIPSRYYRIRFTPGPPCLP